MPISLNVNERVHAVEADDDVPLLWVLLHVSKSASSVPGGVAADRFGPRPIIAAGWVVYALVYVGFAAASGPWQVWTDNGACGTLYNLCVDPRLNHEITVTHGVEAQAATALLEEFFAPRRV